MPDIFNDIPTHRLEKRQLENELRLFSNFPQRRQLRPAPLSLQHKEREKDQIIIKIKNQKKGKVFVKKEKETFESKIELWA